MQRPLDHYLNLQTNHHCPCRRVNNFHVWGLSAGCGSTVYTICISRGHLNIRELSSRCQTATWTKRMLAVKRYSQLPEDNYQKGVLFMTKITSHWHLLVAFLMPPSPPIAPHHSPPTTDPYTHSPTAPSNYGRCASWCFTVLAGNGRCHIPLYSHQ